MTHPTDDLLLGDVDGTLSDEDRAAVDTHLASCARCSQDFAQAAAARSALRAIPEVPAPDDLKIPSAAEAAAAATAARRRSTAPAWQRWVGPAAAVAAAALVLTLVLPKLGGSNDGSPGRAEGNAAAPGVQVDASQVPMEIRSDDYTPDTLTELAGQTASRIRYPDASGPGPAAAEATPKLGDAAAAAKATACIQTAFREVPGTLVRLIRADFQGTPAYVGIYAEGPGAGQAPDTLVVRVAAVGGCSALTFAGVPL